jgi:hypothetical protein
MKHKGIKYLACAAATIAVAGVANCDNSYAATVEQKAAIQEAAMAYYNRSTNLQYSNRRRNIWLPPEESTSQDAHFLDCSGFTHALYYNTFGIDIPTTTVSMNAYGHLKHGTNSDIAYFNEGDELEHKKENLNSLKAELLSVLEVGDIMSLYMENNGHAMLIYDIVKDDQGHATDAVIIHSSSRWKKDTTKLTSGLSWNDGVNSVTGVAEGTVLRTTLSSILNDHLFSISKYLTILRPTINASEYNKITCAPQTAGSSNPSNYTCTATRESYHESEASVTRRKFSGAYLEATVDEHDVDKHDNGYVKQGDTLTYSLKIKNNSAENWPATNITATIANAVFSDSGRTNTSIALSALQAGQTKVLTLSAKATGDYGSKVSMIAKLENLPFGEVANTIGKELDTADKNQIKALYDELKSSYSGTELIDKIYEKLGYGKLGFKDLILGAQYNDEETSEGSQSVNARCNKYFKETDANALINSYSGSAYDRVKLNTANSFSNMLLDGYYAALNTARNSNTCEITAVAMKSYQIADNPAGVDREVFMKSGTLQNGDVLLYTNEADEKTKEDSFIDGKYTVYAFIYADGQFYGVNKLNDGTDLNEFDAKAKDGGKYNMYSIYGRDYFAVLRPALAAAKEEEEEGGEESTAPEESAIDNPKTADCIVSGLSFAALSATATAILVNNLKRRR